MVTLGPLGLGWRAKNSASFINLVSFVVTGEERSHQIELCHDGSHGENVNWRVVSRTSEEDLGRAIPSCAHVIGERRTRSDLTCKAKVSDLNSITFHKQILRLQVSMTDFDFVDVLDS